MTKRAAVIGLDSVPPELLFDKLLDRLPNFRRMAERGLRGRLRTCDPPITVPAWMVMMTGRNPGELGIYGFRHRRGASYVDGYIVNSNHVNAPTVWDVLAEHGKRATVLGVPPGYPPKGKPNLSLVSCFLTPSQEKPFAYPAELKEEVLEAAGGKYVFDVTFRTDDRAALKKELFEMTEKRFDVAERLAKDPWDFFMMHEIGFDRLHHAFWKFFDSAHPKHVPGNGYEQIDLEYYSMVDGRVGRLVELFGEDCATMVMSDHGSKAMKGAFAVNQWLEEQGYLKLKTRPAKQTDIVEADVDWASTKAWGWGGYYARIFFNVKGREAQGVVEPGELEAEKALLRKKIIGIRDDRGAPMENRVFEPEELYGTAVGDKPDFVVYFGDLDWRSAGTLGHGSNYLAENDTGPDDSVHSMDGVFLMQVPGRDLGGRVLEGLRAQDMGATLLETYGLGYGAGRGSRGVREIVEACR
ncbi:MAG: alkaline phosphatase family protein [Nitrososphaerota archaeon]|nr:alkaline phosphatase family protein [Nitrososphaerota archaeon]